MRAALITDKFDFGGGLEHIFQICSGLPSVRFGVFGKSGPASRKFRGLPNVEVFDRGYGQSYVSAFNPDFLHIHHLKPLLALARAPRPKIFTVHGVHIRKFMFQRGFSGRIRMAIRVSLEKRLFRGVDAVVAVSSSDQELLLKAHGFGESHLIYNGVDVTGIRAERAPKAEIRKHLGLNPDRRILLTVARFDYPKGHDILLSAIALIARRSGLTGTTIVLVGGGDLLEEMKAKAAALGIAEHIVFTGSRPDAVRFMHAADAFILPSRYEGLPLTLLEALACGLPIIASATSGISELAGFFPEAILLFENGNASSLADKISQPLPASREWDLEQFDTGTMAKALETLYGRFA